MGARKSTCSRARQYADELSARFATSRAGAPNSRKVRIDDKAGTPASAYADEISATCWPSGCSAPTRNGAVDGAVQGSVPFCAVALSFLSTLSLLMTVEMTGTCQSEPALGACPSCELRVFPIECSGSRARPLPAVGVLAEIVQFAAMRDAGCPWGCPACSPGTGASRVELRCPGDAGAGTGRGGG